MPNRNYGQLDNGAITYAPSQLRIGDTYYPAPTTEHYLTQGWKSVSESRPVEPAPAGSHYEPSGYAENATTITRQWRIVADTVIPRRFSKLKLYGAIAQLGAWATVEDWLKAKTINGINGWMAFQLAQEISEDHALFAPLSAEARQLLNITEEQFDALLSSCILED